MRRLLLKLTLFATPLILIAYLLVSNEGGYSDPFYLRFTTPKQNSLILGTSRAAQGLIPSVINMRLKEQYKGPLFNYAFTVGHSPFGKVYFESITRKLRAGTKNGLFIVAVDPWSISTTSKDPEDEASFPENRLFLSTVENVASNPNLEYLSQHYPKQFYNILVRRLRPIPTRLHEDGWLEVTVSMDSASLARRIARKVGQYQVNLLKYKYSAKRLYYLEKTILFLKQHGEVYLIRLPVGREILTIENAMMEDFNIKMRSLERLHGVPYLDMNDSFENYQYTDGNHLYKESARVVSQEVAEWIHQHQLVSNERH